MVIISYLKSEYCLLHNSGFSPSFKFHMLYSCLLRLIRVVIRSSACAFVCLSSPSMPASSTNVKLPFYHNVHGIVGPFCGISLSLLYSNRSPRHIDWTHSGVNSVYRFILIVTLYYGASVTLYVLSIKCVLSNGRYNNSLLIVPCKTVVHCAMCVCVCISGLILIN